MGVSTKFLYLRHLFTCLNHFKMPLGPPMPSNKHQIWSIISVLNWFWFRSDVIYQIRFFLSLSLSLPLYFIIFTRYQPAPCPMGLNSRVIIQQHYQYHWWNAKNMIDSQNSDPEILQSHQDSTIHHLPMMMSCAYVRKIGNMKEDLFEDDYQGSNSIWKGTQGMGGKAITWYHNHFVTTN